MGNQSKTVCKSMLRPLDNAYIRHGNISNLFTENHLSGFCGFQKVQEWEKGYK